MTNTSTKISEENLFNKGFIAVTIINFIVFLVYYCFVVITAKFATDILHSTVAQAGFAAGIYIIGTLIARLYIGKILELVGRKQIFRLGSVLYLLTTVSYLLAYNIFILDAVRFLNGFAYGTISTAANAIVTHYIPKSKHGEGINYYGLSTSLAAAIGPFVGMLLLPRTGFTFIIILAIILTLFVAIACFLFPVKNLSLTSEEEASLKRLSISSFIEYKVLFISFIALLMGLSYSSVLGFLAIYVERINLKTAGAFFFLVYALVVTFTRPLSGKIFDKYGEHSVMYPSFICLTTGLFLLAYTTNGAVLLISGAFIGLGYGTFMSNGQAVCLKSVHHAKIGVALSTYFIGLDLGLGLGPYVLGTIKMALSYEGLFILCGIIPVVATILYALFYKPRHVVGDE